MQSCNHRTKERCKAAQRIFESVERYLTRKLKLVVNQQKSRICSTNGVEFLGFRFEGYGGQIRVSPKNTLKFKKRVSEITRRTRGVSMSTRMTELAWYLRGWVGYFGLVPIKSYFEDLDKWVRRRIRSCYWKQWRRARTRINNLLKLGIPKNDAIPFGSCSRGPWFMSRCKSVQRAMPNVYLASVGLVSLLDIWSKLALNNRTA